MSQWEPTIVVSPHWRQILKSLILRLTNEKIAMAKKVVLNVPVADLATSVAFFTALGFTFNPQFTSESATSMVISEQEYMMLLTKPFFQSFTDKPICDPSKAVEVIIALSVDNREEVDEMVDAALAAGATEPRGAQDHGFMYQRSFADLDGHIWEVFYMDISAFPGANPA